MTKHRGLHLFAPAVAIVLLAGCAAPKPIVWYCRVYNTPNNRQYRVDETGDRGWSRVYASLSSHVRWRVNAEPPTADRLSDVDLLVILNPEADRWEGGPPPRLMTDEDVRVLADYVTGGGGLLFMSNQDAGHNIEKPRANRLLEPFGMQMGHHDVGLKVLEIPASTPVVGGLRWRFFLGSGVVVSQGAASGPEVWVFNDPQAPTLEGEPGDRVPLMVASQPGSGRVIVLGDSGWTANGTIGLDDNGLILWRLLCWLTRDQLPATPPAMTP